MSFSRKQQADAEALFQELNEKLQEQIRSIITNPQNRSLQMKGVFTVGMTRIPAKRGISQPWQWVAIVCDSSAQHSCRQLTGEEKALYEAVVKAAKKAKKEPVLPAEAPGLGQGSSKIIIEPPKKVKEAPPSPQEKEKEKKEEEEEANGPGGDEEKSEWDNNWSREQKIEFLKKHPAYVNHKVGLNGETPLMILLKEYVEVGENFSLERIFPEEVYTITAHLDLIITDDQGLTLLDLAIEKKQLGFLHYEINLKHRDLLKNGIFKHCSPERLIDFSISYLKEKQIYVAEEEKEEDLKALHALKDQQQRALNNIGTVRMIVLLYLQYPSQPLNEAIRAELGHLRKVCDIMKDVEVRFQSIISCLQEAYREKLGPNPDPCLVQKNLPSTIQTTKDFWHAFQKVHQTIQPPSRLFNMYFSFISSVLEGHKRTLALKIEEDEQEFFLKNIEEMLEIKNTAVVHREKNKDFSLQSILVDLSAAIKGLEKNAKKEAAYSIAKVMGFFREPPTPVTAEQVQAFMAWSRMAQGQQSPFDKQAKANIKVLTSLVIEKDFIDILSKSDVIPFHEKLNLINHIYATLLTEVNKNNLDHKRALVNFTGVFSQDSDNLSNLQKFYAHFVHWHKENLGEIFKLEENYCYPNLLPLLGRFVERIAQEKIKPLEEQHKKRAEAEAEAHAKEQRRVEEQQKKEVEQQQKQQAEQQAKQVAQAEQAEKQRQIEEQKRQAEQQVKQAEQQRQQQEEQKIEEQKKELKKEYSPIIFELCKITPTEVWPQQGGVVSLSFIAQKDAQYVLDILQEIPDYPLPRQDKVRQGKKGKNCYLFYINPAQWACIKEYYTPKKEKWEAIASIDLSDSLLTPEAGAAAISSLFGKKCEVGQKQAKCYQFLFDSREDALAVSQHLQQIDFYPYHASYRGYLTNYGNKCGVSIHEDQYRWLVKSVVYDFDRQLARLRGVLALAGLSSTNYTYLKEQLDAIQFKKDFNTLSIEDIEEFRRKVIDLPMPLTVKVEIGSLIAAALIFATVLAAATPPVAAVAAAVPLVVALSFSIWGGEKERKQKQQDKAAISNALNCSAPGQAAVAREQK
ncbi:MAG: hypothetical protein K0S27_1059 [Gammaproteobacteria bacterium]|jgi:flagellar motor protein MotB|nr:hypothetical protein [Gammaproteobacteria bacterium]